MSGIQLLLACFEGRQISAVPGLFFGGAEISDLTGGFRYLIVLHRVIYYITGFLGSGMPISLHHC